MIRSLPIDSDLKNNNKTKWRRWSPPITGVNRLNEIDEQSIQRS